MKTSLRGLIDRSAIGDLPQRLLFLFLKVEVEGDTDEGGDPVGTMTPVLVTDVAANHDLSFESIVDEADDVTEDWEYVMIAAFGEETAEDAIEERVERCLEDMATRVMTGGDLSHFLLVDRAQNPVLLDDADELEIPPTIH
jgi:hypothetical protein